MLPFFPTLCSLAVLADIKLENTIPTFAKVKLSIKSGNTKLHKCIARIVMETELQNKYQQKKNILKYKNIAFNLKTY